MAYATWRLRFVASLDGLLSKGKLSGIEQMDAEVVETVAGVVRLFDAQLSWHGRKPMYPVPGHRINYWLWGSTLLRMRHRVCCLAAPGWMGPHQLGTTQLSFLRRLSSCCAGFVS